MKKVIALAIIAFSLIAANPVFATEDPFEDWVWLNCIWVYTGNDPNPQPPPPIKL